MPEVLLVTSADPWEMPDERTGELRRGATVWFLNQYREQDGKSLGYKPTKVSADMEMLNELRAYELPALFEPSFGSRPGAQGKATLTLVGLKHIRSVDVFGNKQAQQQAKSA